MINFVKFVRDKPLKKLRYQDFTVIHKVHNNTTQRKSYGILKVLAVHQVNILGPRSNKGINGNIFIYTQEKLFSDELKSTNKRNWM